MLRLNMRIETDMFSICLLSCCTSPQGVLLGAIAIIGSDCCSIITENNIRIHHKVVFSEDPEVHIQLLFRTD
jgi:hypothetical protein